MTQRITPFYLANQIETYNGYLQLIGYPHYYRNNANGGWQQLEIVLYPETSVKQIERGTSRECVKALWNNYSVLYNEAMHGELIITHVEDLGTPNSKTAKRETGNPNTHTYTGSAHQYVQNIMQSCSYWQIWYTLNGTYYTQTYNQSWK